MHPTTVDFYLYSGHEIAVFEPLWRSLRGRGVDAQLVLEPPGRHRATGSVPDPDKGWLNDLAGHVEPLVDASTFASIARVLEERGLPWIEHSRVHADAVVTTQGVGWLLHYAGGLRIRIEYGASAFVDVYGHGTINQGLDAVLAHGPFSARAISAHLPSDRIVEVGYPKWAPAIRAGLGRADAREALGLPVDETIVAWLPTWAHNSTIDQYGNALAELADTHLVVAKPHHNSVRFETQRLAAIDTRVVVRDDLHSLVPLMLAADVVVADSRSGALAETIIADRPAVGLLPGVAPRANGMLAGFEDVVEWCREAGDLSRAVSAALATDRAAARRTWRRWLFGSAGGGDDARAADAVIDLIEAGRRRGTASLPLAELDQLLDDTAPDDDVAVLDTLARAWPLWPDHPRLTRLIELAAPTLDMPALLAVARLVRGAGDPQRCPLLVITANRSAQPVRRLVAAALAAEAFEDPVATQHFASLTQAVPDVELTDALRDLDIVPTAIPAFIHAAATTPVRCHELARALAALGAPDEAAALDDYGRSLVPQ